MSEKALYSLKYVKSCSKKKIRYNGYLRISAKRNYIHIINPRKFGVECFSFLNFMESRPTFRGLSCLLQSFSLSFSRSVTFLLSNNISYKKIWLTKRENESYHLYGVLKLGFGVEGGTMMQNEQKVMEMNSLIWNNVSKIRQNPHYGNWADHDNLWNNSKFQSLLTRLNGVSTYHKEQFFWSVHYKQS